jgi:ABC-type multidrug transport system fused ATPase/permease subunit
VIRNKNIKKFVSYYGPYKAVFLLDLLCAVFISLVDLAYPQILRELTRTVFTKDGNAILQDSLAGIRIVQAFANEDLERKKIQQYESVFSGNDVPADCRRYLCEILRDVQKLKS